jgi:hypothetical protein
VCSSGSLGSKALLVREGRFASLSYEVKSRGKEGGLVGFSKCSIDKADQSLEAVAYHIAAGVYIWFLIGIRASSSHRITRHEETLMEL